MHIDHSREKLIQSVIFFSKNVRKLGKIKLFKILYFLDFMHFKDTGRSVTGLNYSAWKMGPVPVSLFEEIDSPSSDWQGKVEFKEIPIRMGKKMLTVNAQCDFDPSHFSKRELRLLQSLAAEYCDHSAEEMIEKTHLENSPWHKVWEVEKSPQKMIPYDYALRAQDGAAIKQLTDERVALLTALASS
jgi:uncharacterized phage-associated protein